jgi:hypothetical protein
MLQQTLPIVELQEVATRQLYLVVNTKSRPCDPLAMETLRRRVSKDVTDELERVIRVWKERPIALVK